MWCGAGRDLRAMNEDDFTITTGDIGVTVKWTTIEAYGRAYRE
jgi:hypothetical protein